ncbi:MAG: methylase [Planctomycetia bacterium]|nr:methylase [Planctomycetia bacterium]
MKESQQRSSAKEFAEFWRDKGYEKGQSQPFWLALLRDVFGIAQPEKFIEFEDRVFLGHQSYIDGYIPGTRVLIEQKKLGADLNEPILQSDGSKLSPFQQAKRYASELPLSRHPRWIVTCNFEQFNIYDMERPRDEPETVFLKDLEKEHHRLNFLVDVESERIRKETQVSIKAGDLVGQLYDALIKEYKNPESEESLRSLNMLCVRLVFCLYAEDSGVFPVRNMFHDYMKHFEKDVDSFRKELIDLFKVLDTKQEERDSYMRKELAEFPYVNGGLFAKEDIEIPYFTEEIINLILARASDDFDWSGISPTIFGAVFESTLNPETRRNGGMHYTSIENIHKVIDPLFLEEFRSELAEIKSSSKYSRAQKAKRFQEKLSQVKFLDPACGSGNFLTETFLSLRRLENEAISIILKGQGVFGATEEIKIRVSINQFYGIEINDFAVTVARTALWIAELQMSEETQRIIRRKIDRLPLKTNATIVEGNALRLDWGEVVPVGELNYIMGNPPFVGYTNQSDAQKAETRSVYVDEHGREYKNAGKIDYVANWYFKACQFMQGSPVRAAFVSTNSVTQGEQVAFIWKPLYERFGVDIQFAHKIFRWDSEATIKAHVHCVIIGFTVGASQSIKKGRQAGAYTKFLYASGTKSFVSNVNPYLVDAPNVLIASRSASLCDVPQMCKGSQPTDGGFLFLTPQEREEVLKQEPELERFIRQVVGAEEYINNKKRYCLWLVDATPQVLRNSRVISERLAKIRVFRLKSKKEATRRDADTPWLFQENRHPNCNYIIVPRVSSENRQYIPIGFLSPNIICTDAVLIIPNATLYHFGVLTSSVHMAWTRAVCGRLKSDYRYSKDVVYNNFIWPEATAEQRARIEATAQGILDARALYPESSLADLYDVTTMPKELRDAHNANDRAVLAAYGFGKGATESEIVARLMTLYAEATKE